KDEKKPEEKKEAPKDDKTLSPADAVSKPTKPYVDETYGFERDRKPAICMTQHAAMKYCEWLSKKTGKDYRLPTEAEWEYACRAGTTGPYGIPEGAKLGDYAWLKENSPTDERPGGALHAVWTKKPNAWGIYDMHGNVMEWCIDHYVPDAYSRFDKMFGTGGRLGFEQRVRKGRLGGVAGVKAEGEKVGPGGRGRPLKGQAGGPPQRCPPQVGQEVDAGRPAGAAEHLVADQLPDHRLPGRPPGRAGRPDRDHVEGREGKRRDVQAVTVVGEW